MENMSQQAANATLETHKHIKAVRTNLNLFIHDLIDRANNHDNTKLESPEVEIFGENTEALAGTTYGSPEYQVLLDKIKPALDHHYSKNSHHPQFWRNGIEDMSLVDVLEMLADWHAATKRHNSGNIRKSIEINAERFNLSPQLRRILENTVKVYFKD
jgi:hypothetical protein